jgi:hypothetical protein
MGHLHVNQRRSSQIPVYKLALFPHIVQVTSCHCCSLYFHNTSLEFLSRFGPIVYLQSALISKHTLASTVLSFHINSETHNASTYAQPLTSVPLCNNYNG